MIREIDLVSYLPPFMADFKEVADTLKAENPEFALAWKAADRVLQNEFIATADEYGISRFEKILGIYPDAGESLEARRTRVKNRWFASIPYTLKNLIKRIADLLGTYDFTVYQNDSYVLTLILYTVDDVQNEEVRYVMSTMVPVNMQINVVFEADIKGKIYFNTVLAESDIIEIKQRKV